MNIGTQPLEAALEVIYPVLAGKDPRNALIAAKCLGLMYGYDLRWRNAPYLIESAECVLAAPLQNPETGKSSRSFRVYGKLDVRAKDALTFERVVFDHKTTSEDISDPNAAYWRQLVVESQPTHYIMLEWQNGNRADYGLWDVIRKPAIAPKALTKADAARVLEGASYFDYSLTGGELEQLREDGRETLLMYAYRLADDCGRERVDRHFQRRKVPRLDAELYEYAVETWGHGQEILHARREKRWARNSGACFTHHTPCKFLGLCSKHDTLDSGKWETKAWVHPELPVEEGSRGLDILTNSRIRCFQTCRQKHYLTYELGVDRVEEEEREALFFGNLWHSASERYFLELKKQQEKA